MKFPTTMSLVLVGLIGVCCHSHSALAGVVNGDFETAGVPPDDFAVWTTFGFFDAPVAALDSGGSRVAQFSITGFFDNIVQLEQTFTIPIGATRLSFEFTFSSVSGGVSGFGNDSFVATLFDEFFVPINPILPGVLDGFYSYDSSGFQDTAAGVAVEDLAGGVRRVSLDVSSLAAEVVTLDFQLLGDDDGLTSTVNLDNVTVQTANVIPEPASLAIWACLGAAAFPMRRYRRRKMASAA